MIMQTADMNLKIRVACCTGFFRAVSGCAETSLGFIRLHGSRCVKIRLGFPLQNNCGLQRALSLVNEAKPVYQSLWGKVIPAESLFLRLLLGQIKVLRDRLFGSYIRTWCNGNMSAPKAVRSGFESLRSCQRTSCFFCSNQPHKWGETGDKPERNGIAV